MNLFKYVSAGFGVLLLLVSAVLWGVTEQRDRLRIATSIAAHAADERGRPVTLSTKDAVAKIRIMGSAIDATRLATADAEVADANHALAVERADTKTTSEVSQHVQAQLDSVQDQLAASRALAAQRLQQLAAARADQGGGGDPPVAPSPDATCSAVAAASCDEVLALLAEAERNTASLVGWQRWYAEIVANHEQAAIGAQP